MQQCTLQEVNKELKKIGCRSKMHGKSIAENANLPDGKAAMNMFPSQPLTCTFSKTLFTTVSLL